MAAEIVASAFLGSLFESLIPKVNYDKFLDFCRTAKVHSEAKDVMKILQTLEKVLAVAEEKQFEDVAVKVWVDDLRDVTYDLEVILDEFDTYELQRQLGILGSASLSKLKFKWKFGSSIKEIATRLQCIRDRMEVLDLKPVYSRGESHAASKGQRMQRETTSAMTDSGLFVREDRKQKLIDLVLNADSKLRVIAVVGLGGMGKTTLAQHVYHDDQVRQSFDMRVWVCISDQFQLLTILENVLREIGGNSSDNKSLQEVHKKIEKKIVGKTLLLVLDDAWERNHTEWEKMWPLFQAAKQIVVVLTTRDEKVASSSGARRDEHLLLGRLSKKNCWLVFQRYAFENKNIDAYPVLKDIGVQIVKKCDGSPLAAKVLGCILRCESDEHQWKSVLHSKFLAQEENSIMSVLILSYYYLYTSLKRCFAFTAIFPKDYEFEKQEIVLLWMAQGLLQDCDHKEMEDVGHDYFHDLLSRSFFQPSPYKNDAYVMHDLIHDLALEVAGKTCFRLEEKMGDDQIHKLSPTTRYASYTCCKYEAVEKIRAFGKAHSLQTFIPVKGRQQARRMDLFSYPIVQDTLCKLYRLRVLSLRNYRAIHELPHLIIELKHLRYLDFSNTELEVLPDTICRLVNLQTLLLRECRYLVKLPKDVSNLVNMRHFNISGSTRITEMPFGMNKLKSLRTLSNFVVSKDIGRGIQQLRDMNHINGSLCISKLENVTIFGDARQAMLKEKSELRTLTMRWTNSENDSIFQNITENVLEELQPPQKLEQLTIENFSGKKFPRWMGDSWLSHVTSLTLSFCEKCTCLPPLGKLIMLEHLHIKAFISIFKVDSHFYGETFLGSFPSLETLKFEDLPEWEDWFIRDEDRIFPRLKILSICDCPKLLKKFPEQLLELKELVIQGCKSLVVSIPSTLKLRRLEIDGCKEVTCHNFIDLSSLKSLILKNIEALSIPEELQSGVIELDELETDSLKLVPHLSRHLHKVTRMSLVGYPELNELHCRLRELILQDCSIEKLPQTLGVEIFDFFLKVIRCPKLISLPDEVKFSNNNGNSDSTLSIDVIECHALEYIPVFKMQDCSILVEINISDCDSLTGFAKGLLPLTLGKLFLTNCKKLQCLVVEEELKNDIDLSCPNILLDMLLIRSCDSLKYLASTARGKLPFRSKRLHIADCKNIKSLIMSPLSSSLLELPVELEGLCIGNCPGLKYVAERFPINSNVEWVQIYNCGSLKSLPRGLQDIRSLKLFLVRWCEKLEALPGGIVNFVDNNPALETLDMIGWPAGLNEGIQRTNSSLRLLMIMYPNSTTTTCVHKPVLEWGLSRLISLQKLEFYGEPDSDVIYFTKSINSALPSSLTHLEICEFNNLKYVSSRVFKNLGSLRVLWVYGCPMLESFPKGGLPLSLLKLKINGCPKLEEMYKNKKKMKASDWSKISHIPRIMINEKTILNIWLENDES